MQVFEEREEHQTTRYKAVAENQEVTQRTEHTSPYERTDLRDLYQLMWTNRHKTKMFSPSHALLVIFGGGGQGAGEDIHIWMYIYTYTHIFMVRPLCCTEQTASGHFSIFKNTFWQFKWITPSHFHFGPTTAFLFLIWCASPHNNVLSRAQGLAKASLLTTVPSRPPKASSDELLEEANSRSKSSPLEQAHRREYSSAAEISDTWFLAPA